MDLYLTLADFHLPGLTPVLEPGKRERCVCRSIVCEGLRSRRLEVEIQTTADDMIRELGRSMSRCEP